MKRTELVPLKHTASSTNAKQTKLKLPSVPTGQSSMLCRKDILCFYDTWPAKGGATNETRPSLLNFAEELLSRGLGYVARRYPDWEGRSLYSNPFETFNEDDLKAEEAIRESHKNSSDIAALSFRMDRAKTFTGSLCTLASGFKTYRPFLMWCAQEIAVYNDYLIGVIESMAKKVKDIDMLCGEAGRREGEAAKETERRVGEIEKMMFETQKRFEEKEMEVQREKTANARLHDEVLNMKIDMDEASHTNAVLLQRIRKLEKKLSDPSIVAAQETVVVLTDRLESETQNVHSLRHAVIEANEEANDLRKKFNEFEKNYPIETHPRYLKMVEEAKSLREVLSQFRGGQVTPRPRWESMPGHIADYQGSTTDTCEKMVTEIIRCKLVIEKSKRVFSSLTRLRCSPTQKWMAGLGTEGVPIFLQADGRIENTQIPKRQAEFMIREIWRERLFDWKSSGGHPSTNLAEFYIEHLKKRYPRDYMQVSYNFLATLQLHYADPDCCTFLKCLFDEVSEGVVKLQEHAVKSLKKCINDAAAIDGNVDKITLRDVVLDACGDDVVKGLDEDLSKVEGAQIAWVDLFKNDHELNESCLVESVRKQCILERDDFIGHAEDKVLELDKVLLSRREAVKALQAADSYLSVADATAFVSDAFTMTHAMPALQFIQFLRKSHQKAEHMTLLGERTLKAAEQEGETGGEGGGGGGGEEEGEREGSKPAEAGVEEQKAAAES